MKKRIYRAILPLNLLVCLLLGACFNTTPEEPHSHRAANNTCTYCNGIGICNSCGNITGKAQCIRCKGEGRNVQGETTVTCSVCQGFGWQDCTQCKGSGRCRYCNGSGKKI